MTASAMSNWSSLKGPEKSNASSMFRSYVNKIRKLSPTEQKKLLEQMNTINFNSTSLNLGRPSSQFAEAALLKMRKIHESRAWQPLHFR
jgi:hypothetical protein